MSRTRIAVEKIFGPGDGRRICHRACNVESTALEDAPSSIGCLHTNTKKMEAGCESANGKRKCKTCCGTGCNSDGCTSALTWIEIIKIFGPNDVGYVSS